jgi:DNA-3-methyladenine glycosylase I
MTGGPVPGPDGLPRCPWGLSAPDYLDYHDREWGRPLRGVTAMFERLSLEAFQSGLSWLVILRKREGFATPIGSRRYDRSPISAQALEDAPRPLRNETR